MAGIINPCNTLVLTAMDNDAFRKYIDVFDKNLDGVQQHLTVAMGKHGFTIARSDFHMLPFFKKNQLLVFCHLLEKITVSDTELKKLKISINVDEDPHLIVFNVKKNTSAAMNMELISGSPNSSNIHELAIRADYKKTISDILTTKLVSSLLDSSPKALKDKSLKFNTEHYSLEQRLWLIYENYKLIPTPMAGGGPSIPPKFFQGNAISGTTGMFHVKDHLLLFFTFRIWSHLILQYNRLYINTIPFPLFDNPYFFFTFDSGDSNEKIHIFCDVSNIIGGFQKDPVTGKSRDLPFLDPERLLHIIGRGRTIAKAVAVGSYNKTPNVELWSLWEACNWETPIILKRVEGKEQGVDATCHAQAMNSILQHQNGILILMTGDGNENDHGTTFIDVVRGALNRNGWKVELWTWSFQTSKAYDQFKNYINFKVKHLDGYRDELKIMSLKPTASSLSPSRPQSIRPLADIRSSVEAFIHNLNYGAKPPVFDRAKANFAKAKCSEEIAKKLAADVDIRLCKVKFQFQLNTAATAIVFGDLSGESRETRARIASEAGKVIDDYFKYDIIEDKPMSLEGVSYNQVMAEIAVTSSRSDLQVFYFVMKPSKKPTTWPEKVQVIICFSKGREADRDMAREFLGQIEEGTATVNISGAVEKKLCQQDWLRIESKVLNDASGNGTLSLKPLWNDGSGEATVTILGSKKAVFEGKNSLDIILKSISKPKAISVEGTVEVPTDTGTVVELKSNRPALHAGLEKIVCRVRDCAVLLEKKRTIKAWIAWFKYDSNVAEPPVVSIIEELVENYCERRCLYDNFLPKHLEKQFAHSVKNKVKNQMGLCDAVFETAVDKQFVTLFGSKLVVDQVYSWLTVPGGDSIITLPVTAPNERVAELLRRYYHLDTLVSISLCISMHPLIKFLYAFVGDLILCVCL